ncbi:curli-like amyloid fiber formation chaperone CsgH [Devosia albogilva]|uniref:Curli assembly protein CsgC n=1 Tax=Devosia albogilva TaxID=429726 RepID=A0ABW5QMB0_9HYPH
MLTGTAVAAVAAELLVAFQPTTDGVTVVAEAEAAKAIDVTAEVLIQRSGSTGSTTSRQTVEVSLSPHHKQVLARFSTNLPAGHTIEVSATLRSDGRLLQEVTATYP